MSSKSTEVVVSLETGENKNQFKNETIEQDDEVGVTVSWEIMSDLKKEKLHGSNYKGFTPVKEWKRKVYRKAWFPPRGQTPKNYLVYFHGLHEHCSRHGDFVRQVVQATGSAVFSLDWYAHGHSDGKPGAVPSFNYFIHDAKMLTQDVQAGNYPLASQYHVYPPDVTSSGLPVYLFGHSMGGCIALNMLLEEPGLYKGCILSAPLVDVAYGQSCMALLSPLIHCMSSCMPWQENSVAARITPEDLTRIETAQRGFLEDRWNNFKVIDNRLTWELFQATNRIQALAQEIETPVLIMHSEDDPVVPQVPSEKVFQRLNSTQKVYKKYERFLHEMFNDTAAMQKEMATEMDTFMKKCVCT